MGFSPDIKMESRAQREKETETKAAAHVFLEKKGGKNWQQKSGSTMVFSMQFFYFQSIACPLAREQAISMKIICKCSQHSVRLDSAPLKLCQISVFCVARCPTNSVLFHSLDLFFQDFQPRHVIKNSFIFQAILQLESNFRMVEYRIIDNIRQSMIEFPSGQYSLKSSAAFCHRLGSREKSNHYGEVAFQFIGMKYLGDGSAAASSARK